MADAQKEKKGSFGLSSRTQYVAVGLLGTVLAGMLLYRVAFTGESEANTATEAAIEEDMERLALPPALPPLPPEPVLLVRAGTAPRDPFVLPPELKKMLEELSKPKTEQVRKPGDLPKGPDPEVIREAQSLKLKGILGDAAGRIAFINDITVQVGCEFDGFTVLEIRETGVLLKKGHTEARIELPGPAKKPRIDGGLMQAPKPPAAEEQHRPQPQAPPSSGKFKPIEDITDLPAIEQTTQAETNESEQ